MNGFVRIDSEIGRLNMLVLHRPDLEVEQLLPDYFEHMLSDDIPYLPAAQKEHDGFADVLREHGVMVLYLKDLFIASINSDEVKRAFIEDFIRIAGLKSESIREIIRSYLNSLSVEKLFVTICRGITPKDIENTVDKLPLPLLIKQKYPFITDPVSSMYFTRDISFCIGGGMVVSSMSMPFRRIETLFMRYIHKYNASFSGTPLWYDYNLGYSIEGGDHLILSDKAIAVGFSERTSLGAIEQLASKLLRNGYERILVFDLPKSRKYMHLDVLCTMVDYDKFIVNPEVYMGDFNVYELTLSQGGDINVSSATESLESVLKRALNVPAVKFIQVGGGDPIIAAREHWSMGGNSLTIAPGEVITYERNEVTNDLLVKSGIKVNTIPGSELCKGRGGPRCMSMPINRMPLV